MNFVVIICTFVNNRQSEAEDDDDEDDEDYYKPIFEPMKVDKHDRSQGYTDRVSMDSRSDAIVIYDIEPDIDEGLLIRECLSQGKIVSYRYIMGKRYGHILVSYADVGLFINTNISP